MFLISKDKKQLMETISKHTDRAQGDAWLKCQTLTCADPDPCPDSSLCTQPHPHRQLLILSSWDDLPPWIMSCCAGIVMVCVSWATKTSVSCSLSTSLPHVKEKLPYVEPRTNRLCHHFPLIPGGNFSFNPNHFDIIKPKQCGEGQWNLKGSSFNVMWQM